MLEEVMKGKQLIHKT